MKTGRFYNGLQKLFSWAYSLSTGNEPYPLRSFLLRQYERLSPARILDIGCGSGCYALPGYDYLGIDPNPHYVAYCRRCRPGEFEQMSAEKLNLPEKSFDIVFCFGVGHHLPDESLKQVFLEIKRVLNDNGTFFFADPVRPIMRSKPLAALFEWLDEGSWFRSEADYVALLQKDFHLLQTSRIVDQFYQTLIVSCRKKIPNAAG